MRVYCRLIWGSYSLPGFVRLVSAPLIPYSYFEDTPFPRFQVPFSKFKVKKLFREFTRNFVVGSVWIFFWPWKQLKFLVELFNLKQTKQFQLFFEVSNLEQITRELNTYKEFLCFAGCAGNLGFETLIFWKRQSQRSLYGLCTLLHSCMLTWCSRKDKNLCEQCFCMQISCYLVRVLSGLLAMCTWP